MTTQQEAARRAMDERQRLDLSGRDGEAFVRALLEPEPINDRLRDTVRRYRDIKGI